MRIWVNKDQSDVHVGVRPRWVEKVPGHGVGRAEELAGRPAGPPIDSSRDCHIIRSLSLLLLVSRKEKEE